MSLVIPERTIDSLFTFELISAAPTAIVVSPNNNRGPSTPDHEVQHTRRKFVFECKTIYTAKPPAQAWVVRVPRQQLSNYLAHGQLSLVYVLPAQPQRTRYPWFRTCRGDPDANGWCQACSNPTIGHGAVYHRRWAGRQQPISSAPAETRLQPWFNHWAWCVRADDLERHLSLNPSLTRKISGTPTAELPALDQRLEGIAGAARLCHFLAAMQQDHDSIHGLSRADDTGQDAPDLDIPGDGQEALIHMATRSIAELQPLENERRLVVGY